MADSQNWIDLHVRREITATLRLALPLASTQLVLKMTSLVILWLVGQASGVLLAAVAIGDSLMFAVLCLAMGICIGVEPLVAQAMGQNDKSKAWSTFCAGVVLAVLSAVPTMGLAVASTYLLPLVGVDPAIIPEARRFVWGSLPGIMGFLLFLVGKAYLEAQTLTRPLVVGAIAANAATFCAGSFLVLGENGLGGLGAGLAAAIGNLLMASLILAVAWRTRPRTAFLPAAWLSRRDLTNLARVGLPVGLQLLAEVGAFSLAGVLVGRFGATVTAAHQIALGLSSAVFVAMLGLGGATSVRVGYAVGRGDLRGTRRAGLVSVAIGMACMGATCAAFLLFPRHLAGIFSHDSAILAQALPLIQIAAAYQLVDAIQVIATGALRGAADTRFAWLASLVGHWIFGFPMGVGLAFGLGWGVIGIWWGLATGLAVVSVLTLGRFWWLTTRPIEAVR